MLYKNKNKKSIMFPILLFLTIVICMFLFLISVVGPLDDIKYETDFGMRTKMVDNILYKKNADIFFKQYAVDNVIANTKFNFIESLKSSTNQDLTSISKPTELITCKLDKENLNVWYNQKNIDSSNKENEYDDCLIEVENIEEQYVDFLKDNLKEEFDYEFLSKSDINIEKDDDGIIQLVIDNFYEAVDEEYDLNYDYQIKRSLDKNSYSDLILSLKDTIIKLEDEYKNNVPVCMQENKKKEIKCMEMILKDLVYENSPDLREIYDFKLSYIDRISSQTDEDYYGIKIDIIDKLNEREVLQFALILKDTIPYTPLIYDLSNSENYNNLVDVKINKPDYYEDVKNYLVLYSYNDIFSNKPDYESFSKEINSPDYFENLLVNTQQIDHNDNMYYYSNNYKLTAMLSSNEGFNDDDIKKIPIYQIYNHGKNKFERINNRIFVYTFALDNNNNLFISDDQEPLNIIPNSNINGPIPPSEKNVDKLSFNSDIVGIESTLSIILKGYDVSGFDHFDVYVIDNQKKKQDFELTKDNFKCKDIGNFCYYLDGSNLLSKENFEENNYIFSFSSDSDFITNSQNPNLYSTDYFTNNLILNNGDTFDVYIIANNREKIGYMQTNIGINSFKVKSNSDKNFMILDESQNEYKPLVFKNKKIVDNKAPDLSSFEFIEPKYNIKNNNFYILWKSKNNQNVEYIEVSAEIIGETGQVIDTITRKRVGLDGTLFNMNSYTNINRVIIKKIIPIDNNGNFDENLELENNIEIIVEDK